MHILVIEDEKKISNFIKRGLKEEGFMVSVAFNGEEGYELAKSENFALIILDLMIPKIDGFTLCSKLREEGATMPIIMLTAKDSIKDKVTGLNLGANDYLTKPFAFEELIARVRAHLRKPAEKAITKLKVDALELDLLNHKVMREEKEIVLTTKEFSLLEYFMRNEGKIVTRTMISEQVWDINFDTATNIIDVYVNYLRKKVDSDYEKKLIQTIRGRGYLLKA